MLFFVPSSIGSCCSLLGISSLVCVSVRASYLHLFGLSTLELGSSLCRFERERLKWKRWETMLLIVMLESSSRSAPANKAMLMACSTLQQAWRSTIIEVSCSCQTSAIIECKYSRVMMMMAARSCPSSAASSPIRLEIGRAHV